LTNATTRRSLREDQGFTLVELAVAMPIMLIVMGGLVLMLTTLSHWSSQSQEETALQSEARAALTTMEMEIRGAFTGGDGSAPIASASATSITFYSPDEYATTVVGSTQSSFHLREISYRVSNGLLQRQFRTSTNTYPTASCLSCGGSTQWTWGSWSAWVTVLGSVQGAIKNTANACKPPNAKTPAGVFCYYLNTDILNPTVVNPQTTTGFSSSNWNPLTFPISDTSGISSVIVTLQLSTGGSQPVSFTVSDTMTIRGES
jgi:prepilin-type N-terminal cleavage/methylation domain-containing protein